MSASVKNLLQAFINSDPASPDWEQAALALEKVFSRLADEDQAVVVKRLTAAGEAGADSLTRIDARAVAGLPALVELRDALARLGRPVDEATQTRLRHWLVLCDGGADCNPDNFFALPNFERGAVTDHLVKWLRSDLIAILAESAPDKIAAKELKKSLHRARSSGAAAVAEVAVPYVLPEREEYLDEAFLTPPDVGGVSFVYLYRTVFGRNTMFIAVISDTDGIIKFDAYEVPEAKFRKMIDSTRQDPRVVLARADSGYVRRLIQVCEENGRRAGKSTPTEYLRVRRALGIPDEPDRPHPLFKHFPEEELKQESGLAGRSAELAGHRVFSEWALFPLEEQVFVLKLQEIRNSILKLSTTQKRELEDRLYEQEATRTLDTTGRITWRERLLQCAYLLYLVQDEPAARMTAATAMKVAEGQTPPLVVEFVRRAAVRITGENSPAHDPGGMVIV